MHTVLCAGRCDLRILRLVTLLVKPVTKMKLSLNVQELGEVLRELTLLEDKVQPNKKNAPNTAEDLQAPLIHAGGRRKDGSSLGRTEQHANVVN